MNKDVADWLDKHYNYRIKPHYTGGVYIIISDLCENHNADLFFHRNEVITIERVREQIGWVLNKILEQHRTHILALENKIEELKNLQ